MKLSLSRRHAKLAPFATRREKHGQESHGAVTLPLTEITLDALTVNSLRGDPDAHDSMYLKDPNTTAGEGMWRPRFKDELERYSSAVYTNALVNLYVGPRQKKIALEGKLDGFKFLLRDGGQTELNVTFKGSPKADEVGVMYNLMDTDIDIEIEDADLLSADDAQAKLPLNDGDVDQQRVPMELGEPPAGGELMTTEYQDENGNVIDPESNIGRQIRQSETKKKRASRKKAS